VQEFYKCDFSSFKFDLNFSEENEGHKIPGFPELLVRQNNFLESADKKNPTTLVRLSDAVILVS